jgi:hypothetical protein
MQPLHMNIRLGGYLAGKALFEPVESGAAFSTDAAIVFSKMFALSL